MNYIIYMAKNDINNKIYIGQTRRALSERKHEHEHCYKNNKSLLTRAISKYGKENFTWKILKVCHSQQSANSWESKYIDFYDSTNPDCGYNLKGGGYNPFLTEVVKKKIGDAQRGPLNHMYGKTGDKNKMSKRVINTTTGKIYGSASECAREEGLSLSHICAVCRGERNTCNGNIYRYVDPSGNIVKVEQTSKISRIKIRCVETGEIFKDATSAAKKVGAREGSNILHSIEQHTTAYGYHWEKYYGNTEPSLLF